MLQGHLDRAYRVNESVGRSQSSDAAGKEAGSRMPGDVGALWPLHTRH